jgi:hypothetical protein
MPRQQAGVAALDVDVETDVALLTLGDVLLATAATLPEFGKRCLDGSRLKSGILANINGRSFTIDPATRLTDQDSVLILSSDVGGH